MGFAQGAFDAVVAWAAEHDLLSSRTAAAQDLQFELARLRGEITAARAMLLSVCDQVDATGEEPVAEVSLVKLHCTALGTRVAAACIALLGPDGDLVELGASGGCVTRRSRRSMTARTRSRACSSRVTSAGRPRPRGPRFTPVTAGDRGRPAASADDVATSTPSALGRDAGRVRDQTQVNAGTVAVVGGARRRGGLVRRGPVRRHGAAQLGAEVIRVDPPAGGSDAGRWPLSRTGASLFWDNLNKGKQSVTIDHRTPKVGS